jgi:hypothetical protein
MRRRSAHGKGDPAFEVLNRSIPVAPAVRIALAVVLLLGGAVLVLSVVLVLFAIPHRPVPHPTGALLVTVLVLGLGCGFFFVGVRLLRSRSRSGVLFSPRARTICGLLFGAAAIGMGVGAWWSDSVAPAIQAIAVALFSFLLFRSASSKRDE